MSNHEVHMNPDELKQLTVAQLVSIQKNVVKAIGNLNASNEERGEYRKSLETLDELISKASSLNFNQRTLEFQSMTELKDATQRIKDSAKQMEEAAKTVGTIQNVLSILDKALKAAALIVGV